MIWEFHLVNVYSCHGGVNILGWNHFITFTPSTRYCTVCHSPSFAIPQLSPNRFESAEFEYNLTKIHPPFFLKNGILDPLKCIPCITGVWFLFSCFVVFLSIFLLFFLLFMHVYINNVPECTPRYICPIHRYVFILTTASATLAFTVLLLYIYILISYYSG